MERLVGQAQEQVTLGLQHHEGQQLAVDLVRLQKQHRRRLLDLLRCFH